MEAILCFPDSITYRLPYTDLTVQCWDAVPRTHQSKLINILSPRKVLLLQRTLVCIPPMDLARATRRGRAPRDPGQRVWDYSYTMGSDHGFQTGKFGGLICRSWSNTCLRRNTSVAPSCAESVERTSRIDIRTMAQAITRSVGVAKFNTLHGRNSVLITPRQ